MTLCPKTPKARKLLGSLVPLDACGGALRVLARSLIARQQNRSRSRLFYLCPMTNSDSGNLYISPPSSPPARFSPSLLPAWYMLMLPPPESRSAVCPNALRAFLTKSIFSSLESSSQSTRKLMQSTTFWSYCSTSSLVPLKALLCKA